MTKTLFQEEAEEAALPCRQVNNFSLFWLPNKSKDTLRNDIPDTSVTSASSGEAMVRWYQWTAAPAMDAPMLLKEMTPRRL